MLKCLVIILVQWLWLCCASMGFVFAQVLCIWTRRVLPTHSLRNYVLLFISLDYVNHFMRQLFKLFAKTKRFRPPKKNTKLVHLCCNYSRLIFTSQKISNRRQIFHLPASVQYHLKLLTRKHTGANNWDDWHVTWKFNINESLKWSHFGKLDLKKMNWVGKYANYAQFCLRFCWFLIEKRNIFNCALILNLSSISSNLACQNGIFLVETYSCWIFTSNLRHMPIIQVVWACVFYHQ